MGTVSDRCRISIQSQSLRREPSSFHPKSVCLRIEVAEADKYATMKNGIKLCSTKKRVKTSGSCEQGLYLCASPHFQLSLLKSHDPVSRWLGKDCLPLQLPNADRRASVAQLDNNLVGVT